MARVLLIACNRARSPYPVYPLGMSMVAEAARRAGHEVAEWDVLWGEESGQALEQAIDRTRPDVVGISLRNIDNTDSVRLETYGGDLKAAVDDVRKRTDAPVVLGGSGFSLFPEALLATCGADYGVVGEGERAFRDLLDSLEAGHAPRERLLRGAPSLDGAEVPSARREPGMVKFYLREGGMANVQTKRGCPHRCAYCTYPCLEGQAYRFRPAADVVDEVEYLRDRHGVDYLSFTDSVFNDARGRYLEIAEEMARRETGVPWMAFFRPAKFTAQEAALLRRAGLSCAEWGTDCSTDETLAAMGKDFVWADVVAGDRALAKEGVSCGHFIIFGGPGETPDTVGRGLANIEALGDSVVFAFRGVRILPGTEMQRIAQSEGAIAPDADLLPPTFYHAPGVDPAELDAQIRAAFHGRRDRVYSSAPDDDLRVQAFHRMGRRGPIWDLILAAGGARRGASHG